MYRPGKRCAILHSHVVSDLRMSCCLPALLGQKATPREWHGGPFPYCLPVLLDQALKSASEEYSHILDIASRYAVYRAGVALSCKRQVQ